MPQSYQEYSGSSLSATTYSVTFKYLSIDDVHALGFDGNSWTTLTLDSTAPRNATNKTITLASAPTTYTKIRLYRATATTALIDFQNGSRLSEADLDTAYQQGLFVAQEVAEDANTNQFDALRDSSVLSGTQLSNFASQSFTATSGQTEFTLTSFTPQTTAPEAFVVSIDGAIQAPSAYTVSIGNSKITFSSGVPLGAIVVVVTGVAASSATTVDNSTLEVVTATNQVRVKDGGITSAKLNLSGERVTAGAFRAAQGVPNSADSSTTGFAFGEDGDTGMFCTNTTGASAGAPIVFYGNNVELGAIYVTPAGYKTFYVGDFTSPAQVWIKSGSSDRGQIAFGDSNDDDVGAIAYRHDDNSMRFKVNANDAMSIDSGGRLLVGLTSSPTSVGDSIACAGRIVTQATYNNTSSASANLVINSSGFLSRSTSSARYKENIQDYDKGIEAIKALRPVTYESNDEDDDKTYAGFIAEEVHDAELTEFVDYNPEGQPDALHYANMTAVLTKALQEALTKIESLEARVEALENA